MYNIIETFSLKFFMLGLRPAPFADPTSITKTKIIDLEQNRNDSRGRGKKITSIVRSNSLRKQSLDFDQDSLEDRCGLS